MNREFHQILLLSTTFSYTSKQYLDCFDIKKENLGIKIISYRGATDILALQEELFPLPGFDILLCNERKLLTSNDARVLERYFIEKNPFIHFIAHKLNIDAFESWIKSFTDGNYLFRYEGSTDGLSFKFLVELGEHYKKKRLEKYQECLQQYFKQSWDVSVDLCKLQLLNEWNEDELVELSNPEEWKEMDYTWRKLLDDFPRLPEILAKFKNISQMDQVFSARLELADYFYGQH